MYERDVNQRLTDWLREGPIAAPAWVLEAAVDHARRSPHDGLWRDRWRDVLSALTLRPVAPVARAGVLLALVAIALALCGIVYVGAQLLADADVPAPTTAPAGFMCPAGSTPNRPGPANQVRPEVPLAAPIAFDTRAGRIVLVDDQGAVWTFDVCTNTWRPGPQGKISQPEWLVYDARADLTILSTYSAGVWAYDFTSGDLAQLTTGHGPEWERLAVYDPIAGAILKFRPGLNAAHLFDTSLGIWTELSEDGDVPPDFTGQLAAFDESVDHIVLYLIDNQLGARTYEFDRRSLTWARPDTLSPVLMFGYGDLTGHQVAYDAANARTVIFSNGRVAAYDAANHVWELVFEKACGSASDWLCDTTHAMTYDPVNERVVVVRGPRWTEAGDVTGGDVLAFDLATRTWLLLLAPTGP